MKNVFDLIEILYHRDNIVVSLFFKCACDCLLSVGQKLFYSVWVIVITAL